jgi:hypothetical protein
MKKKDQFGFDVDYEYITIKLDDNDCAKLEFIMIKRILLI